MAQMNRQRKKLGSAHNLAKAMLLLALGLFASVGFAGDDRHGGSARSWRIAGIPTTGPNDVCGVPQWRLPAPLPAEAHFTFLGEVNTAPQAADAIPLTTANCRPETLLATTTDKGFQGFFGFPDADQRLKNRPLREVPVGNGLDGVRGALPEMGVFPANPLPPTRSLPNDPITLGDWFKARGTLKITCRNDGSSDVKAKFDNLIPNGVYTMFGIWKTALPGTTQIAFLPVALGGFPNVVAVDAEGAGSFERHMDYCPKDPTPDGSVLMFVDLAYHADGAPHGGFPFTPVGKSTFQNADGSTFESTRPAGIATFVQMGFPVTVEPLH